MKRLVPKFDRGRIQVAGGAMLPYLKLGGGDPRVVLIPGSGDGLATAFDAASNLAWFYRKRVERGWSMLVLSRRQPIPRGYAVEDHARDYARAIEQIGVGSVILECNSAGGFVGQMVAATRPELVAGLVLASTAHRLDERARCVISRWLGWIERGQWGRFAWDSSVKTYRVASRLRWLGPLARPILGAFSKPRDPGRLKNLLLGLLDADNSDVLPKIQCPTLVFGGERDPVLAPELQSEMADLIPGSEQILCPGYLHGADLESPDYAPALENFVKRVEQNRQRERNVRQTGR